jgi:Txe/YoeB family toxin of toxin-antitoxin system
MLRGSRLVRWKVIYTKQARKDSKRIDSAGHKAKVEELIGILQDDPYRNPPPFEKLHGELSGYYSRRINIQHRLVYLVKTETRTVKIYRMWTHYE